MECAADGHKGRRRRGWLKNERGERSEGGRKMRATRVEGYVGRLGVKFLAIRKGGRTFLSRFQPLRLIKKASHDTSDLFPPFLGIILYIQRAPFLPSLSLFLSRARTPRTFPDYRRRSRDSRPMKSSRRYVEVPSIHSRFCQGRKNFANSWRSDPRFVSRKWHSFINFYYLFTLISCCPSLVSGHVA